MTTRNTSGRLHGQHPALWRRATHGLGKLWAKVITFPEAYSSRREETPPEYFNYPPF